MEPNLKTVCPQCGGWTFQENLTCGDCRRYGMPDAGKVPYQVGDQIHQTFSPRTKYQIVEIRPADNANRRGGVKICRVLKDGSLQREKAYSWRRNPGLDILWSSNDEVIEWRKANMRDMAPTDLAEAVAWAEKLWDRTIAKHRSALREAKEHDDPGTCVIGAGIQISNVAGKQAAFIQVPASAGQGSLTWERSVADVVAYLRGRGLDARYDCGRMD